MVGDPALIERMQSFSLPWSVNSLALEAIQYVLEPNEAIDHFVMDDSINVKTLPVQFIKDVSTQKSGTSDDQCFFHLVCFEDIQRKLEFRRGELFSLLQELYLT